ncbi:uncharacterized protein LOC122302667 [Carya illinoinensis]|uniref:uncharacterized protein LOC122302667 n=1 Tax=Carya illinoinensis TaxID=32201 RepID=UPI001C71A2D2|nr:uncharacterized protein LOC122302667 [Carya illinoinensis]
MVRSRKPCVFAVAELFVDGQHLGRLKSDVSFEGSVSNQEVGGKRWVLWSKDVKVSVLSLSSQSITTAIELNGKCLWISFVYAKCYYGERRQLWDHLCNLHTSNVPWMVIGDFNIIRTDQERIGGHPRPRIAMEKFNSFVDRDGLSDLGFQGNHMTWCNGHEGRSRCWARLDRALVNSAHVLEFPSAGGIYLPKLSSDHALLQVDLSPENRRHGHVPFKFQQMWTTHENFSNFVTNEWKEDLEEQLQLGDSKDVELDLLTTKVELDTWNTREEIRLAQQAKQEWLNSGEASSKFFKAMASKNHKLVRQMKISENEWLKTPEEVHIGAVDFFQNFLATNHQFPLPDLSSLIDPVIQEDDNVNLLELPSIQEVKQVVFSIPTDSSPGLDGLGLGFYKAYWDIVAMDVVDGVHDFFRGGKIPREFTASFLVLIPKVDNPKSFDKIRPISLCSVFYKICTKILVTRLSHLLPPLISEEQGAFIPGRSIFENVSLIQEMIQNINKPVRGGNVVLKIDMAKAYDSMNWDFLIHSLASFGFSEGVCSLVRQCISSPWFSVVMNGIPKGFFQGGRCLRQDDPLSHYLFILGEEILSRLLKKSFQEMRIIPFQHPRGAPIISHLLYADDIVIFANVDKKLIWAISEVLTIYESWSGKRVNKEKSSIIFSKIVPRSRRRNSLSISGFSEGLLPFKYLGVPIVSGRLKAVHFDEFFCKIRDKIGGWQSRLLFNGARLLLLKHVLGSLPIHLLSILQVLKSVLSSISRCFSNLFWDIKMVDRRNIGSIGLRCVFFKAKYIKHNHVSVVNPNKGSRFWKMVIRSILDVIEHSKWKPRRGDISFWLDKWIGDEPLAASVPIVAPKIKVQECYKTSGWDMDLLCQLVGTQKAQEIVDTFCSLRDGEDRLIWVEKEDGNFSSKSAWEVIRGSDYGSYPFNCHLEVMDPLVPCSWKNCSPSKVVCWVCLKESWVKLNIDGSSRENLRKAGAGGLIRDSRGNLVLAFSYPLDFGTNNYAEFMSLLHGVRHVRRLGFRNVEIEMNSMVVVNWILASNCPIWYLEDYWIELMELLCNINFSIRHVYRQGSSPTDFLAKLAFEDCTAIWESLVMVPPLLRGLIRTDKLGIPYIRF